MSDWVRSTYQKVAMTLMSNSTKHMFISSCIAPISGTSDYYNVGSVIEWLKRRARDQRGLGLKPTHAILLCPWKRHFTAHSLLGGPGKQF